MSPFELNLLKECCTVTVTNGDQSYREEFKVNELPCDIVRWEVRSGGFQVLLLESESPTNQEELFYISTVLADLYRAWETVEEVPQGKIVRDNQNKFSIEGAYIHRSGSLQIILIDKTGDAAFHDTDFLFDCLKMDAGLPCGVKI